MKKIIFDQLFFNAYKKLKIKRLDRNLKTLRKINQIKIKYSINFFSRENIFRLNQLATDNDD